MGRRWLEVACWLIGIPIGLHVVPADAYNRGIDGRYATGCQTCHGADPDPGVSVTVDQVGGPSPLGQADQATVRLTIEGGAAVACGFDLHVAGGTVTGGSATRSWSEQEISHRHPLPFENGACEVDLTVRPDGSGVSLRVQAAGNSVNDDFAAGGDGWNLATPLEIPILLPTPTIATSTDLISTIRRIDGSTDPEEAGFTVRNAGDGILAYSLSPSTTAISVLPETGVSGGEEVEHVAVFAPGPPSIPGDNTVGNASILVEPERSDLSIRRIQVLFWLDRLAFTRDRLLPATEFGFGAFAIASAVARSGDRAALNAALADRGVYVFQRSGDAWEQQDRILPPADSDASFGRELAFQGGQLYVSDSRRIYTFAPNPLSPFGDWIETGRFGCGSLLRFCQGLAVAGDRLVITADNPDLANVHQGFVEFFDRVEGEWVFAGSALPTGSDDGEFVGPVGLDGESAIVGVPFRVDDADDPLPGLAFVYERGFLGWREAARLEPSDPPEVEEPDAFGAAVDVEGDWAVVGAPGLNEVFVFRRADGVWSQAQHFGVPDGFDFGASVDLEGDLLVVGAPNRLTREGRRPAVYLFRRVTEGSRTLYRFEAKLDQELQPAVTDDGPFSGRFGHDLALDGERLIVGAPRTTSQLGIGAGAAYVFGPSSIAIVAGPSADPDLVPSGGTTALSVEAEGTGELTYAWTASCPDLGASGSFGDAAAPAPLWIAPANRSDMNAGCTLAVMVINASGLSAAGEVGVTVLPVAHQLVLAAPATVSSEVVESGGRVTVEVQVEDSRDHVLGYTWSSSCAGDFGAGSFVDPLSPSTTYQAPVNRSDAPIGCTLEVAADDGAGGLSVSDQVAIEVTPVEHQRTLSGPIDDEGLGEPIDSEGVEVVLATVIDSRLHDATFSWSSECPALPGDGRFEEDPRSDGRTSIQSFFAPVNRTGDTRDCVISVRSGEDVPESVSEIVLEGSYIQPVLSEPDSDGDGTFDGLDPDTVGALVAGLPPDQFRAPGSVSAFQGRLDAAEAALAAGQTEAGLAQLVLLRDKVDGCGAGESPDADDWITDCALQDEIRAALDRLVLNLQTG